MTDIEDIDEDRLDWAIEMLRRHRYGDIADYLQSQR